MTTAGFHSMLAHYCHNLAHSADCSHACLCSSEKWHTRLGTRNKDSVHTHLLAFINLHTWPNKANIKETFVPHILWIQISPLHQPLGIQVCFQLTHFCVYILKSYNTLLPHLMSFNDNENMPSHVCVSSSWFLCFWGRANCFFVWIKAG